jgi:hypothetical protein
MLSLIKKLFGFSTSVTQVAEVPAKKSVPSFLLPETGEEYVIHLAEAEADHEAKRLAVLKENKELEVQASELEGRDASPAQKELNRREANRLREQAKNWRFPNSVNDREIERKAREEEARRILGEGVLVCRTERLHSRGGGGPSPNDSWDMEVQQDRKILLHRDSHFLVVGETFVGGYKVSSWDGEKIWATNSVAQFTDEELKAIS